MQIIKKCKEVVKKENNKQEMCEYCFLANSPFKICDFFSNPLDQKTALEQRKIKEAMFIVEGEVKIIELNKGIKHENLLTEGDFVYLTGKTFNIIKNNSGKKAKILTFTFIEDKKGKENIYFV